MLTYKEYKKYKQRRKELHHSLQTVSKDYVFAKTLLDKKGKGRDTFEIISMIYSEQKELYNSINSLLRLHKILYKQTLR